MQSKKQIFKDLNIQNYKSIDLTRPYVLLCRRGRKYFILKLDHFNDEVEILTILANIKNKGFIIPQLYKHNFDYLLEDYIPGKPISVFSKNAKINKKGLVILKGLKNIHKSLNSNKKLQNYTKGWDDTLNSKPFDDAEWLVKRINRWILCKDVLTEYKLSLKINQELFHQIKGKNNIQFGAFSASHIRIYKNKLAIFDFGRHIRWAPVDYDLAYLWWSYLADIDNFYLPIDTNWWIKSAENLSQFASSKKLFWSCILERLFGLGVDLSKMEKNHEIAKAKKIDKIRQKMFSYTIDKIK